MKRIMLISVLLTVALAGYGQSGCSGNNAIFKTDNSGTPKEVYTLGSNPEFPFLRNMSTPEQVAAALKKNANKHGMHELNNMLMDIGFANGVQDVTAANISADYIPAGTNGNMGDGNYSTSYIKLMADGGNSNSQGVKSWKISSPTGCYMYVLAKCGNAFYPSTQTKKTACINVPVNLTNGSKEVTLENSATKTTKEDVYVYYHKKHRKHPLAPEFAGLSDPTASTPVLLNTKKNVEGVPQTYRVSLSTPDNNVQVCEDKPLDLTANINVERTSEYTGYYPTTAKRQYKEVSKHVYRKTARKMRKSERKEAKVARMTHLEVETDVAAK